MEDGQSQNKMGIAKVLAGQKKVKQIARGYLAIELNRRTGKEKDPQCSEDGVAIKDNNLGVVQDLNEYFTLLLHTRLHEILLEREGD